jgi:hypothetical protein
MTYYAGLDVSLRTVNLCVIDDAHCILIPEKFLTLTEFY